MAKINDSTLYDWVDGQTVDATKYKQEREILRVAINDNDDSHETHQAKTVDPSSTDSTRDKHVSNNDIKEIKDDIASNEQAHTTHVGQVLDPASSDTTRNKHVSNNDIKNVLARLTTNETNHITHTSKQLDPTSQTTTRDKHLSNQDIYNILARLATNEGNFSTHTSKMVEPTNTDTTRDKHLSNADINGVLSRLTSSEQELSTLVASDKVIQFSQQFEGAVNLAVEGAQDGDNLDTHITSALAQISADESLNTIIVPPGDYTISQTIDLPRGVRLVMTPQTVITLTADVNFIRMRPESQVYNGYLRTPMDYTSSVVYLDGEDIFSVVYENTFMFGTMIRGADRDGDNAYTGKGIHLYSNKGVGGDPKYVSFVHFQNCQIFNYEYGILLETDETIASNDEFAWVNGNNFDQMTMMNCLKNITLIGMGDIPRDCTGNIFDNMQVQVNSYTDYAIYCEGGWNRFNGMFWDLHRTTNRTLKFGPQSRFNIIECMHGYEGTQYYEDKGYHNQISSPTNHVPDQSMLAYNLSRPYKPNMLGNQDDYMMFGHLRGYTVSQVQTDDPDRNPTITHPLGTDEIEYNAGDFSGLFTPDGEAGAIWDGSQTSYDDPLVIEIDMTSDPIIYGGYVGVMSALDWFPQNLVIQVYDGSSWQDSDWYQRNEQNGFMVSPPWFVADRIEKIRLTMWGSNDATNGNIQISRVFATSTKDMGNAFLPQNGGEVFGNLELKEGRTINFTDVNGNERQFDGNFSNETVFTPNTFDYNMLGDQDDGFTTVNEEHTFTQTGGAAHTNGNLSHVFMMDKGMFCSWDDFSSGDIQLEIDFTSNPINYIGAVALLFGKYEGEYPTSGTIEYKDSAGGAWKTFGSFNTDNGHRLVFEPPVVIAEVHYMRITFSGTTGDNIKLYRIMGVEGVGKAKAFLSTQGGDVYGDTEFKGDLNASSQLTIPVRTSDPFSPPVGSIWFRSDL